VAQVFKDLVPLEVSTVAEMPGQAGEMKDQVEVQPIFAFLSQLTSELQSPAVAVVLADSAEQAAVLRVALTGLQEQVVKARVASAQALALVETAATQTEAVGAVEVNSPLAEQAALAMCPVVAEAAEVTTAVAVVVPT
jgi:hypothetical protein